jgi:hypothetical protein
MKRLFVTAASVFLLGGRTDRVAGSDRGGFVALLLRPAGRRWVGRTLRRRNRASVTPLIDTGTDSWPRHFGRGQLLLDFLRLAPGLLAAPTLRDVS